ncbi:putative BTB/POZ domain-containing protein 6 [Hypsibius exemplaris]|uniref:BTB/POZ domain-containing protein 6 n=1 Tax=Hypsibius exemplaris TaxID=2072580 RepID=A0A1W0X0A6_HYPEX|nr:putative BTB/POZ domain-containing protein 6 [Hypsibius exemplaris]
MLYLNKDSISSINAQTTKDWQSSKQVKKRFRHLWLNPDLIPHDVVFRVGLEGQDVAAFRAHRLVLAAGSSVFWNIFFGGQLASEPDGDRGSIPIVDVEPVAFKALLGYIYAEETSDWDVPLAIATLICAKKYKVRKLARICRHFVQHHMSPKNACLVLAQAQLNNEFNLAASAMAMICSQFQAVTMEQDFLNAGEELLIQILKRDDLSMREQDLYHAARSRLVPHIRLPLLTPAQLCDGPKKDLVITNDQHSQLCEYFFATRKPIVPFTATPREPRTRSFYVAIPVFITLEEFNYREKCAGIRGTPARDPRTKNRNTVLGELVIEARKDLFPHACELFLTLIKSPNNFHLLYGPTRLSRSLLDEDDFDEEYEHDKLMKSSAAPIAESAAEKPTENILDWCPGAISFYSNPETDFVAKRNLEIYYPFNTATNGNKKPRKGVIFGKLVSGLECLMAMDRIRLGLKDCGELGDSPEFVERHTRFGLGEPKMVDCPDDV